MPLFYEPGLATLFSLGGDGACSLSFLALMGVCVDSYSDLDVTAGKRLMPIPPCRAGASSSPSYYTSISSLSATLLFDMLIFTRETVPQLGP
jgi:hypothetical protein